MSAIALTDFGDAADDEALLNSKNSKIFIIIC